jgi:vacuolar-type H+-ATPase subunit F/Vma7
MLTYADAGKQELLVIGNGDVLTHYELAGILRA